MKIKCINAWAQCSPSFSASLDSTPLQVKLVLCLTTKKRKGKGKLIVRIVIRDLAIFHSLFFRLEFTHLCWDLWNLLDFENILEVVLGF